MSGEQETAAPPAPEQQTEAAPEVAAAPQEATAPQDAAGDAAKSGGDAAPEAAAPANVEPESASNKGDESAAASNVLAENPAAQTSEERRSPENRDDDDHDDENGYRRDRRYRSRSRSRSPRSRSRSRSPRSRSDRNDSDHGRGGADQQTRREGDWDCPNCHSMCFASRGTCFKCRTPRPGGIPPGMGRERRDGDWDCPNGHHNFASRAFCFRCRVPRPGSMPYGGAGGGGYGAPPGAPGGGPPARPGDWNCIECGGMNFASRMACFKCRSPRPQQTMPGAPYGMPMPGGPPGGAQSFRPGDWMCENPACRNHNFASRDSCQRCKMPRPAGAGGPPGGHPMMYGGMPMQQPQQPMAPGPYGAPMQPGPMGMGMGMGMPPGPGYGAPMRPQPPSRPGDWNCSCGAMVFGSRDRCYKCQAPRPEGV
ncbi:Hypothetical Protein FCC1311_092072 [Hondaea fermentalgiana]|uniref:RanBP2-type domain-containing protein n=1 Tax=Hondaea fermentalgiana TaxID=2315210 RepID=A0A2R5GX45_9STRA|nr:Hypothetical Protein FCC1311_092072 [Hondaea fermentalgiana]|eukprot:GBG32981.1 Hypothetical Protein FCC1311_092072 [Hondaea fermentalgiana]